MIKLEFFKPLTAVEIRDPAVKVCEQVAAGRNLYAKFHQRQQAAFGSYGADISKSQRPRVGNGKHKEWRIDYQEDELHVSNPRVVGRILLRSVINPVQMQFGGFDHGKYGEPEPIYSHVIVYTPSELDILRPIDPNTEMLALTYAGLRKHFEEPWPRLF